EALYREDLEIRRVLGQRHRDRPMAFVSFAESLPNGLQSVLEFCRVKVPRTVIAGVRRKVVRKLKLQSERPNLVHSSRIAPPGIEVYLGTIQRHDGQVPLGRFIPARQHKTLVMESNRVEKAHAGWTLVLSSCKRFYAFPELLCQN